MNQQQSYRWSCFHVGWMRGIVLVYDNSLALEMQYQKIYALFVHY